MRHHLPCLMLNIFACSIPSIGMADPVTIEVAYSGGSYTEVLAESAKQFQATHPDIKIVYRAPVVETYDQLLQSTLRSAVAGDLPDVSLEGNQNVGVLVDRKIPVELDSLIAAEKNWGKMGYGPGVQEVGRIGGKTYALAYAASVPTIYFNIDLLKRAGVDTAKLPTDWKGITEVARKVQGLGGGTIGGLFDYYSTGNWTLQALITSQGGNFLSQDGTDIGFDGPEGLRALKIIHDFGEAGTVDMTQAQMLQAFSAGNVGVFTYSSSFIVQIETQIAGKFEFRAAPWPILSAEAKLPTGGRTAMIYTTDPNKQKAAWEYVKFLTGPIGQSILVKGVGSVPVNELTVSDPSLLGSFYEAHPNQKVAFQAVPRLTKWATYPGSNPVKVSEIVRDHLRRVLIKHEDPATVLADIVKAIRPLLAKQ